MKRLIVANWKMHLTLAQSLILAQSTANLARTSPHTIVIAPSFPWLAIIHETISIKPPNFYLAGQTVSSMEEGAFTGDVSAKQLKGIVKYCIVGHSERRKYHNEHGAQISSQIQMLIDNKITPIVCFGELTMSNQKIFSTQITRDLRRDLEGLRPTMLAECVFAYEPLWAIGTSHPANPTYLQTVIRHVKQWFKQEYQILPPVIYGGSVTESNAQELGAIRELDGILVGGASLQITKLRILCEHFDPRPRSVL